jgi:peptidoglycan hydrolase-like protein with peptidoglycan-binding domain
MFNSCSGRASGILMNSLIVPVLVAMAAASVAVTARAAPAAKSAQIHPKPIATVPVHPDGTVGAARPKLQTPADTAGAMTQADRLSIQSDLAWIGVYNGLIDGEASSRMVAAIKAFQKSRNGKQTGVLNPHERTTMADAARKLRANVGWKHVSDPVTGARLGLPGKLVPKVTSTADGTTWASSTGTIAISLDRRKEAGATTATVAARERALAGRKVAYSAVKPDFFVLSGTQGLKKFYLRGQTRGNEVRVLTVLYDQATEGTMAPIVVAMSSAFDPFSEKSGGPPPPPRVEYSTGIVVSGDGAILASRDSVNGCTSIVVNGHGNADRIAQDEANGLALLRIYGTTGLKALALRASDTGASNVIVTGIADPERQDGHAAVTTIRATAGGDTSTLSPDPAPGFAGAVAIESDGTFAGVVRLKPAIVAGPAAAPASASLVSAATVQAFLRAHHVAPVTGPSDAKAAVLRIICVRK